MPQAVTPRRETLEADMADHVTTKPKTKMKYNYDIMTPCDREKSIKHLVTQAKLVQRERREVARILLASETAGAFGPGEMNSYAKRISGVDIRVEVQGVYEAVNVLRAIRAGILPASEQEFDKWGSFPVIMLSSFMSKRSKLVPQALEIIRSGRDLTNRLKKLRSSSLSAREEHQN